MCWQTIYQKQDVLDANNLELECIEDNDGKESTLFTMR